MANHKLVPCVKGCGRKIRRRSRSGQCVRCFREEQRAGAAVPSQPAAPTRSSREESFSAHGNHAELSKVVGERVRSLEQLIRVCEIDTQEWEVERFLCNKWDVGMKMPAVTEWVTTKDGRSIPSFIRYSSDTVVTELYQVKVWLKRRVHLIAARDEIKELIALAKETIPARKTMKRKSTSSSLVLELAIPDLHLGKLAWAEETGHAHYDSKIAEALFDEAVETLLERTEHHGGFERILFPVGNDLLHADNQRFTTTGGTQLDGDTRFPKMFKTARIMLVRTIERLRTIAPVDVVMTPGNHDELSTWQMGDSLECYFHSAKDVRIDNAPRQRKYYQHGTVLLMFTHGDKGKRADYPLVMATERPELFGVTRKREVHLGHKHQEQVVEYHGVKVRIIPALCPPDAWHSENQFVGMTRGAEAFVWDKREGLIDLVPFTVVEDS